MAQNHHFSTIVFRLADCALAHSNTRSVGQAGSDLHNHVLIALWAALCTRAFQNYNVGKLRLAMRFITRVFAQLACFLNSTYEFALLHPGTRSMCSFRVT